MKHHGTATLTSPRLILRRFYPSDAADCFSCFLADRRVFQFISGQPRTQKDIEEWLSTADSAYDAPDTYYWAIQKKDDGRVIGEIFVDDYGERNQWCELDWKIGPEFWNQGFMTEAAGIVAAYLLTRVGFHRVQAKCAVENLGSERVMQKLGMRREGIFREFFFGQDGRFHDVVMYSLLQKDLQ